MVSDTLVKNIRHSSGKVLFYKLSSPLAQRGIYVCYKRNKYYSKAMESFISLLEESL